MHVETAEKGGPYGHETVGSLLQGPFSEASVEEHWSSKLKKALNPKGKARLVCGLSAFVGLTFCLLSPGVEFMVLVRPCRVAW